MSANNGLISDAVSNLGNVGIFVFPIVIIIILYYIDRCSEGIDMRIMLVTVIYISILFLSSFVVTILVTHGLIFLMFIMYLISQTAYYNSH